MSTTLMMPKGIDTRELIEGHPLGIRKIIQGDLREKTWVADGQTYTVKQEEGILLYDSQHVRPGTWFLLEYNSGQRGAENA